MMTIRTLMIAALLASMMISCSLRNEQKEMCAKVACESKSDQPTILERDVLFRENGRIKDHYFGYTKLILAAREGDASKVESLLKDGEDVNWKMQWGLTALMWAADGGHTSVVKLLIDHGADVNAQSEDGLTALMFAARQGRLETVKVLLGCRAQVAIKDHAGKTAEVLARENGHEALAELLR